MIIEFRHVGIVVNDLEKAMWFYHKVLGLEIIVKERLSKEYSEKLFKKYLDLTFVKFKPSLEIYYFHNKKSKSKNKDFRHFALTVTDIEKLWKKLHNLGFMCYNKPISDAQAKHSLFFTRDPFGNLIEFVEEIGSWK